MSKPQSRRHFFASLAGIAGALGLRNHLAPTDGETWWFLNTKFFRQVPDELAYEHITYKGVKIAADQYTPLKQHQERATARMRFLLDKELYAPNDRR